MAILKRYAVEVLVDVRRWPKSKRYPHFDQAILMEHLTKNGLVYRWMGECLGGYRKKSLGSDSPNTEWRSRGFRNYADYTMTPTFREGMEELTSTARAKTLACI
jgi:uncharacterized protein (DUF488 family)